MNSATKPAKKPALTPYLIGPSHEEARAFEATDREHAFRLAREGKWCNEPMLIEFRG